MLPSLAIQAWHEVAMRQARLAELRAEAGRFALQAASEVNRMLEGARNLLTAVGEAHRRNGTYPGCGEGLAALSDRMPRYASIGVSDAEGRIICSSAGSRAPASIATRPYFLEARATRRFVVGSLMEVPRAGGGAPLRVLPMALPITADGAFAGVVITSLDSEWLSSNLASSGALPPEGSMTVADRNGIIVAVAPDPAQFIGTTIPAAYTHLLTAPAPGVLQVTSQDGTQRMLGYVPVGLAANGLYVSAGFATGPALQAVDRSTLRGVLLVLAGLASALAAAWLFGRLYLRGPVDQLLEAMRRWTAGDHTSRSSTADRYEIGRLAAGFNAMADAVAAREQDLRASEGRLRAVLGQLPVAVVLAEIPSGREVFRNARAEDLLPQASGAVPEPVAGPLRLAIAEGRSTEGLHVPLRRPDGAETVLSVSAAPVHASGGTQLAVAAFLDVGERYHAERQRALLTAELRHRVKNALAVVQSVVAQTLAQSATLEVFKASFMARLTLLSRAQDLLFSSEDGCVRLDALVAITLAPFGAAARAEGPEVLLAAKQTLSLALVLHEMATNAAKHGALRVDAGGALSVTWTLEGEAEAAEVVLCWRECSSLPIGTERRRGFGNRLIERCVAHDLRGRATPQFDLHGMVWTLRFPRPTLTDALQLEPALPA
ncbi:sensor histidine kinase [Falsiroseomonas selenitidurans]|uniref:histidine kinase n=1 Tax=Falsiroseomonas selenitidurans TaxID=2716335 RepID=A0ABX1DYM6_9PROT|nr:HWE histidine kinase domain-containing protein [Falsiroseomonas selenitidurans]NKC29994.1 HAMP domain-containing protein [Falsiroseomonas selenitidurans]